MTPVMVVIVTVEITCQEDPCGELWEGVPVLTRGDRVGGDEVEGSRRREERDWGLKSWGGGEVGWTGRP